MLLCGGGFGHIFPKENIGLYNKILESNGTVMTEYEFDKEPTTKTFPKRNRIVSGLADGVVVIEAHYRSGTTITAKIAKNQGKPIFCVPNNIDSKYGIGTNELIKNGAKLITSSEDIIEYYKNILPDKIELKRRISKEYELLYKILKDGPQTIHNLVMKSGKNISEVNSLLTMMELEELIIKLPGEEYKIIE